MFNQFSLSCQLKKSKVGNYTLAFGHANLSLSSAARTSATFCTWQKQQFNKEKKKNQKKTLRRRKMAEKRNQIKVKYHKASAHSHKFVVQ